MENSYNSSYVNPLNVYSDTQKLIKRIKREFKRVMYIGDIKINDAEYEILLRYLVDNCRMLFRNSSGKSNDPVLATALVQFGIHEYDGRFWPHFKELFFFDSVGQTQCNLIGKIFVYTLKKNNKKCLGYDEMVNSILMHAFVTEYYAKDLFDFLLMYYERDLDRNLDNHTKEMRNYLIHSMKREDNTGRSYKIKKHTADAVTANEHGCKIRIRRILKMIDDYMFYDILQEQSSNRVTKLFVDWAKQSKNFAYVRRKYAGVSNKGKKRFSSPYLCFDTESKRFIMKFPVQNIPLNDDELDSEISWRISCSGHTDIIDTETEESVTGCKTLRCEYEIDPDSLFYEYKIELIKNGTDVVRKFVIREEEIRFFDNEWDMVSIYDDYIPAGDCFAFSKGTIECICNEKENVEFCAGLNLYTLYLEVGDVIKYPGGTAKPVGKEFEDGILPHGHIHGACVLDENEKRYDIYSVPPVINFTAEEKQLPGTLIWINNKKYTLSENNYISFSFTANSKKKGCILKMDSFNLNEGIFSVGIDIPGSKKDYFFEFAVINNFGFDFPGAPYIFKEEGKIRFNADLQIESADGETELESNFGFFDIYEDFDNLLFNVSTSREIMNVSVTIPVLKWKFDSEEWRIDKPEPLWYMELPDFIYLKFPAEAVTFSMDMPEVLDEGNENEDENEDDYQILFRKLNGSDVIKCDTTKIRSWLGRQDAVRELKTDFGTGQFSFTSIVTKCILNGCELKADYSEQTFTVKGNIIGFAECFVDLYFEDELIAEKVEIRTRGAVIKAALKSGKYTAVFFEQDDEDDDEFGFGEVFLQEFDRKTFSFVNSFDFTDKRITINKAVEITKKNSIFAPDVFEFSKKYYIDTVSKVPGKPLSFTGVLRYAKHDSGVKVFFMFENPARPERIKLFADIDGTLMYFYYGVNKELKPVTKTVTVPVKRQFNPDVYDFIVTL